MKSKEPYKDINHTLQSLKKQVFDGLPYAVEHCPKFETPDRLFYWLKSRVTYKNDPEGVELIQTLPTLLNNNWHGSTGYGDCDCFTTAALTLLVASGFKNIYVVLVGRNRFTARHIYCGVIDNEGIFRVLDLTNNRYDYERPYPYKQHLKFGY